MQDDKHDSIITDVFGPIDTHEGEDEALEQSIIRLVQESADMEGAIGLRKGNTASYAEKVAMLATLQEAEHRLEHAGHFALFPDEGPYRYDKYERHMQFFTAGTEHRERIFMAANRVGKSIAGAYEMTCHLTGMYPHWWKGRRFLTATDCWAAGDTSQTTRDIVQSVLMGEIGQFGTGLIPGDLMEDVRMRPGVPGGVDSLRVKHTSGGISKLGFKSFDQKRRAFQGTAKHVIWLDEEAPHDVYGECLIRTMTTGGILYVTFTPLMGMTAFVTEFQKQVMEQELQERNDNRTR
jgi:phage terminase large subunit-like protein